MRLDRDVGSAGLDTNLSPPPSARQIMIDSTADRTDEQRAQ